MLKVIWFDTEAEARAFIAGLEFVPGALFDAGMELLGIAESKDTSGKSNGWSVALEVMRDG